MIAQLAPPPALAAPLPAPHFAPPLGQLMRLVTSQDRRLGKEQLRFVAERRLLFMRDGSDYVAELTLERVDVTAPAATAARFRRSQSGLLGRTLRFRLDAGGRVVALDDLDGHWAAQMAGFDGAAQNPLRSIAAARRLPLLASLLSQAIADEAMPPLGIHSVEVPLPGSPVAKGTETVTQDGAASWTIATVAETTEAANFAALSRRRTFTRATGLLQASEEVTRFVVRTAEGTVLETLTTTRTQLMVS